MHLRHSEAFIEVRRGGGIESLHRVHAALINENGELLAHLGDPERVAYFRSAAKPFQALPLVSEGVVEEYGFSDQELAVCCASHNGEPAHVETVLGLLQRIGGSEDDLACGPQAPYYKPAASALRAAGRAATRIHNNCPGKHAGMLALAGQLGAEKRGYRRADHPVQMRIRREISEWTGVGSDDLQAAIDGCGVLTYALPLTGMALAYARLVAAANREPGSPAGRVVGAMTGEPYYVAGSGRLETDLMNLGDRFVAKIGAEGVYCVGVRERSWGLAIKIEDGNQRGTGPAVVEFLSQMELISEDEVVGSLADHHIGAVTNTLDEPVGELRSAFTVRRSD